MLTSCYNLNISPQAQEASAGDIYHAGEPYDKYPENRTSPTFASADNHLITFRYHNGQWQAEVEENSKEYSSNASLQRRQLPVFFELDLSIEDLVNSNPPEQKLLLHLCPDQPGYVYVGRAPSQAKPHHQLLSSPAAKQQPKGPNGREIQTPAIPPATTQPQSFEDKASEGIASQAFLSQGGQQVRFMRKDGKWWATVTERLGGTVRELPVGCERHGDIEATLLSLQEKPARYSQGRIHVLPAYQGHPCMVYLGVQGLY